jgi:hypothetical protein
MTINEYNRLKWGAILRPSGLHERRFVPKAIYVGKNKRGDLKVVMKGRKTISEWNKNYWLPIQEKAID